MNCDIVREALSARIDGEREPVPSARVDEHVATCTECRGWYSTVQQHNEQLRSLASGGATLVASPELQTSRRRRTRFQVDWRRSTLAAVGAAQIGLALAQALGANVGLAGGHGAMMGGHLLNESTAWSIALGFVMMAAALYPPAAIGLAGVLVAFTAVLAGYVIHDAVMGAVTTARMVSHVPVVVGSVMALWVWRTAGRPDLGPIRSAAVATDEIVLPDNASRGRRRGHLWPTDGTAA